MLKLFLIIFLLFPINSLKADDEDLQNKITNQKT